MPQPTVFPVTVSALWAEGRGRPEFLATGTPQMSWQVQTDAPGWLQHSYELEIRPRPTTAANTERTDTVRREHRRTAHSQHQPWPAEPIRAYDQVAVRERVTAWP